MNPPKTPEEYRAIWDSMDDLQLAADILIRFVYLRDKKLFNKDPLKALGLVVDRSYFAKVTVRRIRDRLKNGQEQGVDPIFKRFIQDDTNPLNILEG